MTEHTDAPLLRKTRRGRWEADKAPEVTPILVSKKTAAAALSLCVRTVDHLIATKQLPCRRIGKKSVRIPYKALLEFSRRDHIGTVDQQ
jgi:hypothetical protein